MLRRKARKAFTLIELLLVLVILAVLAAVVIPKLTGRVGQAKRSSTITQISSIKTAVNAYETDNGKFPSQLQDLWIKPADATNWHQYLEQEPLDGWNHQFKYDFDDDNFYVISAGENGSFGDDDDIDTTTKGN